VVAGAYAIPVSISSPSFGQPVMTLRNGTPFPPLPFPNFDVGQFPQPGYATQQAPAFWIDQNAGRPPRQLQWSIGVQRELSRDLVVEATFVGNVGVWWVAPHYANPNAITPDILSAAGLSLNSAADIQLLSSPMNSTLAATRGFSTKLPYSGFPTTATVAQALRPYPQFNTIIAAWAWRTLGTTIADQGDQRFSHGLSFTAIFTWSKRLTTSPASLVNNATTVGDGGAPERHRSITSRTSTFGVQSAFSLTIAPMHTHRRSRSTRSHRWSCAIGRLVDFWVRQRIPIPPRGTNSLNTVLLRANGTAALSYANRVPGEPRYAGSQLPLLRSNKEFVLNPKAWTQPAASQWGTGGVQRLPLPTQTE
jgi:hypothetical protein